MTNKKELKVPSEWAVYFDVSLQKQEIDSAKTARNQIPKTFKVLKGIDVDSSSNVLLDLGCGKGNMDYKNAVESLGFDYNGCDPFNKPKDENVKTILKCMSGQSDIVTLNNVLNTVSQIEVRELILRQCWNAVNPNNGIVFIAIYEGTRTKEEKDKGVSLSELPSMVTRDGWQRRAKTEAYLQEVENIFENVIIKSIGGVKLIIASKNKKLNLIDEMVKIHQRIKKI